MAGLNEGRDRSQARRLARDVLRDLPALEYLLGRLMQRPLPRSAREVHFLLLAALSELRLAREPPRAVVHANVEASRAGGYGHLTGLVNAVLRGYQRRAQELETGADADPERHYGHPAWLIDEIRRDHPDHYQAVLAANNRPPPLWLRVNRRRIGREAFQHELAAAGHVAHPSGVAPDALALARPAAVRRLPGYVEGHFSIQDAGAQLAVEFLELDADQRVLDACAAPGGKSGHILERAEVDLTAVELDPARIAVIRDNLERLGVRARVITADAAVVEQWWDGSPFDRILIDAPCTATGVLRRHPDIRWLKRPGDRARASDVQARLLDALWPLLVPGGILVYATCSVLAAENAVQGRAFLERHADARVIDQAAHPGRPANPGRQVLPGDEDMDGFYYLAVRRLHRAA